MRHTVDYNDLVEYIVEDILCSGEDRNGKIKRLKVYACVDSSLYEVISDDFEHEFTDFKKAIKCYNNI